MRIALLSASYAPELTGIGPYSAELAQALTRRGHEVRVIASFPFYPEWAARIPPRTFLYRHDTDGALPMTRCRAYVPRKPTPLLRLLHELSWVAVAGPAVVSQLRWAQVWIVVSPPFGSALLGACVARFCRRAVHLHVQDLVPDVALESGQLRSRLFVRVATVVARWVYQSFQSASVLSESMARGLRRYSGAKGPHVVVTPNWVRRTDPSSGSLPLALRGRPYAVYAGSSGRKQDLGLLVKAAELLATRKGPVIAVLGDGPGHEAIRAGGRHIVSLGLVDDTTYAAVVGSALAGIVTLAPGVSDSVVPSKLAGYLGSGRPVIVAAGPSSEAVRVVKEAGCGFVVHPGAPDLLAEMLCRLAADKGEREALGARGHAYAAAHWDKERVVDLLEQTLCELTTLYATSVEQSPPV